MTALQFSASHGATIQHLENAREELRRGGRGSKARALAAIDSALQSNRRAGDRVTEIAPELDVTDGRIVRKAGKEARINMASAGRFALAVEGRTYQASTVQQVRDIVAPLGWI
jgi:hypothetical protein